MNDTFKIIKQINECRYSDRYKYKKLGFIKKIQIKQLKNGCIICTSHKRCTTTGYYLLSFNGVCVGLHRLVYEQKYGKFPNCKDRKNMLYVCHKCNNRKCVNINHLFSGTCKDNIRDMYTKERDNRNKLTIKQIKKIRKLASLRIKKRYVNKWNRKRKKYYYQKKYIYQQIADMFGVGKTQIYLIVKRIQWKNIN